MDCDVLFYETTYKRFYQKQWPDNPYAKLAPPIPEKDPILIPGYSARNLTIEGEPKDGKTWPRPDIDMKPEEYADFLEKLKIKNKPLYDRVFTDPNVDVKPIIERIKDKKLSTYGSAYSPDYYVSRKEDLKWRRLKLDTSMFKYQETLSKIYYSRIEEIPNFTKLAKPFHYPFDEEQLKKEMREISKTGLSSYYVQFCDIRIPRMKALLKAGKIVKDPIDRHTERKIGEFVQPKEDTSV